MSRRWRLPIVLLAYSLGVVHAVAVQQVSEEWRFVPMFVVMLMLLMLAGAFVPRGQHSSTTEH